MANVEKRVREINLELHKASEEQLQTLQELAKQEQGEKDLFEINKKSNHLFEHLLYTWNKDRELFHYLEEEQSKLEYEKQKIMNSMENKRKDLTQKSRRLNKLEDNLYNQLRSLEWEGK
ncbi:MAG TPA: DUF3958 family protein [Candidatus Avamphibacillus sp.]|nr:DUF3958 family protein [Candidatus Avamphibacillus sp.]